MSPARNPTRRADPLEIVAREMCLAAGIDPDSRVAKPGSPRGLPAWCNFREAARAARNAREAADLAARIVNLRPQEERFQNSPLKIFGDHDPSTIAQMRNCMAIGNAVQGVICADGHLGYAQPVGGVIAYEKQISISGVGFDIGCGNMAVRLDTPFIDIEDRVAPILADVHKVISFGVGRVNEERVEHELFDDGDAWRGSGMGDYRQKAIAQLGTVGSGNHYVDLMRDKDGFVWIGVHFGSRGLGHTSATRYLKAAGGKNGMHVAPAVVDEDSELGRRYIAAMGLAGRYAYAGREWVTERVRQIIGGSVTEMVHNHHKYAWREMHGGRDLWVVRKGATPAFPGQRGFVGGSMGDDAVILEGVDSEEAKAALYSTVHGAGRLFGRKQAIATFTKPQMDGWLQERGVMLSGGGVDESPMAYRRLPEVLAHHAASLKVLHSLRPFAVAMAGEAEFDPWKD
jgi:tRNA-splicing ligase RtcB (3'-phosphate/5'-hydroxy nucleic acid ligase)